MANQSIQNYIILSIFIVSIVLMSVFGIIVPKNSNEALEKYRISQLPPKPKDLSQWLKLPKEINTYYANHFGFRFPLLSLYRHIKFALGDAPLKTAFFGTEPGWIFYKSQTDGDIIGDYRNINSYSPKQLQSIVARLLAKQKYLKQQGVKFLYVIAPSKHYIYPEYLPTYIKPLEKENKIEQLVSELKKHPEINFVYLAPLLQQAKNQRLYFKADTHWNSLGANIAQYEIAKKIKQLFPNKIKPFKLDKNEFTIEDYQGDLAQYMGLGDYFIEKQFIPQLDDCSSNYLPKKKKYNQTFSTKCRENGLDLLVYRDSFFSSLQPFISTYFDDATFIWKSLHLPDLKKQLKLSKPDLVIEEKVDRYIK